MRISFVSPSGALGGAERSLLDVLTALRRRRPGIEIGVVLLEGGPLEPLAREVGAGVQVTPLPDEIASLGDAGLRRKSPEALFEVFRQSRELVHFVTQFRAAVLGFRPDVVHTNGFKAHYVTAALVRSIPSVAHARDFVSSRSLSRWLVRALPRRRFAVIANSKAVRDDYVRALPAARVEMVYNAVDVERFSADPERRLDLARASGLPPCDPGTVKVGLVATYARWKGQPLFIEAAARAQVRSRVPLRFYVVGGPQYRTSGSQYTEEELRAVVRHWGLEASVGLVPFQADPAPVFRALDVAVHASTEPEPFGRSIVEAMAAGCAVIVARAGGASELFHDDVSGVGFPPGDVEALSNAIVRLSEDAALRHRLSLSARAEVRARFGLDRLGDELLAVYDRLLADG